MRYYDVDGYDHPLLLSEEHAEEIGATEHQLLDTAPSKRGTKAEWVDYAVSQGADPALADTLTRADLIEQYGG